MRRGKVRTPLKPGDRVLVLTGHPWAGRAGNLIGYELYGPNWWGWRVRLDFGKQFYAKPEELQKVDRS